MAAEERSYCTCAGIYRLLPIQVAAMHVVLAALQLLFLYEAGITDSRTSLVLVSHGKYV